MPRNFKRRIYSRIQRSLHRKLLTWLVANTRLQAKQDELRAQQLKDSLDAKIAHRPAPEDLTEKNILKEDPAKAKDGGVQSGVAALEKSMASSNIEAAIAHRPPPEELIAEGILNKDENPKKA